VTIALPAYDLNLRIPTLPEVTESLLTSKCAVHELSDKGRLGEQLTKQVDPGILLRKGVYEVIAALTTPRSKTLLRELMSAESDGSTYRQLVELAAAWGGRVARRFLSSANLVTNVSPHALDALELLTGVGWAERGLGVRCDRCGLYSFVPLIDAQDAPSCPACHAVQSYTRSVDAVLMHYRLNGAVDRASDQGVIPHLLVLAAVQRHSKLTALIPGANVTIDGTSFEVDLFGVSDGRVLAGEVKANSADFTKDQIRRDIELSSRLAVDVHVMASPRRISRQTRREAERAASSSGLELLVLDGEQLRP
jgi:hypothetical protein